MKVRATIRPAAMADEPGSSELRSVETEAESYEEGRDRIQSEMVPQGWQVIAWVVPRDPVTESR